MPHAIHTCITHSLIIHDDNLVNMAKTTELLVKVAFDCADAQPEHAQDVGRIGRLLGKVSPRKFQQEMGPTIGACDALRAAGDVRRKESLAGLRERDLPLDGGGGSLSRDSDTGAAGGGCSL